MAIATNLSRRHTHSGQYGPALFGGIVWIAGIVAVHPGPFDVAWAKVLLLLAPLVLVPLGLRLVAPVQRDRPWQLATFLQVPSALLLGCAYLMPQGILAGALAIGWIATTALIALHGVTRVVRHRRGPIHDLFIDAGLIYLCIGSGWAVLDRMGIRPLGFDEVIVLLTAIHFHYAGFALPIAAGLAARRFGGRVSRAVAIGVIGAVPLVAVGITATQLGFTPLLECAAAWILAIVGMAVGGLHIALASQRTWPRPVRTCWMIAGVSLIASMALAAVYGCRFFLPVEWLDIPWMRAVHGTANALGFGLVGLLGWTLTDRGERNSAIAM